ncbi:MAG: GH3 auxin-responsive promoter family protein [Candidatus Thorarchaeota archaeon]|nr:GH3 auxin-responsive promoter family protein [Candidatus Thorarchaeota archaeon]
MSIMRRLVSFYAKRKQKSIDEVLTNPIEITNEKLMSILHRHRDTLLGKQYRFDEITTPEQFRQQVPLSDYESMKPYFELTYADPGGGILTKDPVYWYLQTSGTSGEPKKLPVTKRGLKDVSGVTALCWMAFMNAEPENPKIVDGTLITFGAAPELGSINGVKVGYATGVYARNQNALFQRLIEPGEDVFNIDDMDLKMRKYAELMATRDVTGIQGITTLSLALVRRMQNQYGPWLLDRFAGTQHESRIRDALRDHGTLDVGALWPNLRLVLASGIDPDPYREWISNTLPNATLWNMYGASEGVFAGQLVPDMEGMQLFTNTNYFEFIPEDVVNEQDPEVLPLSDVKAGNRYEIVITNIQGYYRYRIGDMVTFESTNPYTIRSIGRCGNVVNLAGEKITEEQVARAMRQTAEKTGYEILDYSVIGIIEGSRGHYVIAAMFQHDRVDAVEFVTAYEEAMKTINPEFRGSRETGAIGPTVLYRMNSSAFEHRVRTHHLQAKPVPLTTDTDVLSICEAI